MDKIERKKATRVPVSKSARKVYKYSGKLMDKKSDDSRLLEEGMKKASPRKSSPAQKRLKVKDMPRKQQMAVKASMAEQSAVKLKKSPALAKLSASCKAAARRKFKVYPSAYANMWASKTQKKGKC